MAIRHSKSWFAAKWFGYGARSPIAWQGWVFLLLYFAFIAIAMVSLGGIARFAVVLLAVACFVVVVARKTEGGLPWHWRRGASR